MTQDAPVQLTIPHFAVRCDADISLTEMAAKISSALGCRLVAGDYHKIPGAHGILLGMDIGLYEWGGVRGRTFRFEGDIESPAFSDFMQDHPVQVSALNLSQMVADVLTVVTGTSWRVPTPEDRAAAQAYGEQVERWFAEGPGENPYEEDPNEDPES